MPAHLDRLMFVLQVSMTQRSLLTQNASVTLTHICRQRSNPLHHSHGWSLSLNVPPRLERTNKSSDLPLICSLASAWATVNPAHQGQALHRGVSISTAFCFYRSVIGMEAKGCAPIRDGGMGTLPLTCPRCSTKEV